MRFIFILIALVALFACNRSKFNLDDVKKDMTMNEVLSITKEPTRRVDMGTATDEHGDTTHIIIWHYGDNESVTFVNGKVNDIDMNIKATQERLQHIIDSAKAASGTY